MNTFLMTIAAGLALAGSALAQFASLDEVASQGEVRFVKTAEKPAKKPTKGRGVLPADFRLTVLHNNDGESKYLPIATGPAAGNAGFSRFLTLVNEQKALALQDDGSGLARGVVMISSGDNILPGSTFDANNIRPANTPFYDSIAMQLIGYDAITLGNHDFDQGPAILSQFINGVSVPPSGPFVSANLNFSADANLAPLTQGVAPKLAASTLRNVNGRLVGIVGATTTDIRFISSPGLFVQVNPVVAAVQAEINNLQSQGANIIILSTHLQGLSTELSIIPQLLGVDVVIAGGGSELMASPGDTLLPGDAANPGGPTLGGTGYPRTALNAAGQIVPVVTTSGDYKYLGRLVVDFDTAGNVLGVHDTGNASRPLPVTASILPNPQAESLVTGPVAAYVATLSQQFVANTTVALDGRNIDGNSGIRARETNFGNLFTDSLLWQATVNAPLFNAPVPDIAIQNGGGIRNNSIITGTISEQTVASAAAFANNLVIVPNVSAERLKELLENAVSRVPTTSGNGRFAQISGFRFSYTPSGTAIAYGPTGAVATPGTRVREVVLNDGRVLVSNGVVVPGAPSVNLATIDFLAIATNAATPRLGGDQYPLGDLPFIRMGASYRQALSNYMRVWLGGAISADAYPEGGEGRIIRLP
jgi:5'-nucleotidase / UDP-sugar diphosphatase